MKCKVKNSKITKEMIEEDEKFNDFMEENNHLTPNTHKTYLNALYSFSKTIDVMPMEIIDVQRKLQRSVIKDNIIIEYNPNNSLLNDYIHCWIQLKQNDGLKNSTLNVYQSKVRNFLKYYGLRLPKKVNLDTEKIELKILAKEDIVRILEMSNPLEKALYTFMLSTGIRGVDIRNMTIEDFMNATAESHNSNDVGTFIKDAPRDMMGFWEFIPIKTQRNNIECRIFNSPESSNLILDYLKVRMEQIEGYNKRNARNPPLKLDKKDKLFIPYRKIDSREYTVSGFNALFAYRNQMLNDALRDEYKSKLESGEISDREYGDLIENLPNFAPHQLRKYTLTAFAKNNTNLRMVALFEGHSFPLSNDESYIMIDRETLSQEYMKSLDDLTFLRNDVKTIESRDHVIIQDYVLKEILNILIDTTNEIKYMIHENSNLEGVMI